MRSVVEFYSDLSGLQFISKVRCRDSDGFEVGFFADGDDEGVDAAVGVRGAEHRLQRLLVVDRIVRDQDPARDEAGAPARAANRLPFSPAAAFRVVVSIRAGSSSSAWIGQVRVAKSLRSDSVSWPARTRDSRCLNAKSC